MALRKGRKTAPIDTELRALLEELEYGNDVEEARAALSEVEHEGTVSWDKVKSDLLHARGNSPQSCKGHGEAPNSNT